MTGVRNRPIDTSQAHEGGSPWPLLEKHRQRLAARCYLPEEAESQCLSVPEMPFLPRFGRPHRPVSSPVVAVLCTRFSMKDAKNDIPRREAGTKVKFLYVSCLPLPFCRLSFITSYQSYFCLWGVSRKITYCTESGVLNLCKGKKCVMAKIIYCMASPLRVSLL